jgi:hypothetical protein
VNSASKDKSRLVGKISKDPARPSPDQGASNVGDSNTNLQSDSCMVLDSAGEPVGHYPAGPEPQHQAPALVPEPINPTHVEYHTQKAKDEHLNEVLNQETMVEEKTETNEDNVMENGVDVPEIDKEMVDVPEPHPLSVYRETALIDMSPKPSRAHIEEKVPGMNNRHEESSQTQDVQMTGDGMPPLPIAGTDSACMRELTTRLAVLEIDPNLAPPMAESLQIADRMIVDSAQSEQPGTLNTSEPQSNPVPSTQASTAQAIPIATPTIMTFALSKQPGTFMSSSKTSSTPTSQAFIRQPIQSLGPLTIAFAPSKKPGTFLNSSQSSPTPASKAPGGLRVQSVVPIVMTFAPSKQPGTFMNSSKTGSTASSHGPTGQLVKFVGPTTTMTFAPSKKPGTFLNSSKTSQTPSSQAPASQPIQSAGAIVMTFAPSKQPGTFTNSSKTSPTASSQGPTGQLIKYVGPTTTMTFAPSKKPGTFLNSSKTSQAPSSQSPASQPIQLAGPIVMEFAPSKRPCIFDIRTPKGNAAVSKPPSSNESNQGVGSSLAIVLYQGSGSFGGGNLIGDYEPMAPAFSPSSDRYPAMELDEAQPMADFTPSAPAFSPSKNEYPDMELDEPQMSASNLLTAPATVPAMPATVGASQSTPVTNENASPLFVFPQGSATSTANYARPQAGGSTKLSQGSSKVSALLNARIGAKVSEAQPLGRVRKGFRDRSEKSRQKIEACMGRVPEQYKIDVHKVLESKVCDEIPARSSDKATSIPELAKLGPGARVAPSPRREQDLSHESARELFNNFRGVRAANGQVWLDLITTVFQSGHTPKEILSDDCGKILDTEWVIDYERLDRLAWKATGRQDDFLNPESMQPAHRQLFDEALEKVMSGGGSIFDKLVGKWALGGNAPGANKDLVMQCLERAGWTRADSKMSRFMNWSLDAMPCSSGDW